MDANIFDLFISKANEYKKTLDIRYDSDIIMYVDSMVDWVNENNDTLYCDSIGEIFDEYLETIWYNDGGYKYFMFPNGDEENEEFFDEGESEQYVCIKEMRKFCCRGSGYYGGEGLDEEYEEDEDVDEEQEGEDPIEEEIWDYINRHALFSMGYIEEITDPNYEDMIEKDFFFHILFGIKNGDNDKLIVAKTLAIIMAIGYYIKEESLLNIVETAREKCKHELFVMGFVIDMLYNKNVDPVIVLSKVMEMLP